MSDPSIIDPNAPPSPPAPPPMVPAPRLSDAALDYASSLLNDPAWVAAYPAQAAVLARTHSAALAMTGQDKPTDPDLRSPAQREYDRLHALSPVKPDAYQVSERGPGKTEGMREALAAAGVPEYVGSAVLSELTCGDSTAEQTKTAFEQIGRDYAAAVAEVTAMFKAAGHPDVKVERFSASALMQLQLIAAHKARHSAGRPKD